MSVYSYCRRLRVAKEGLPYIGTCLVISILLLKVHVLPGLLSLSLAFFLAFFFRDPERSIPVSINSVLSPADGRITEISPGKISIYLSLFDVHINRSPISGTVKSVLYRRGKFRFAFDRKTPEENENNLIKITNGSAEIAVRQVAGKLARRIVCYCRETEDLKQGDRIGMIRFGSCVQVYLPERAKICCRLGEKARAGQTVLATLSQ